jgi:hypothetical protein
MQFKPPTCQEKGFFYNHNTQMQGAKPPQIAGLMAPSPSNSCRRHIANPDNSTKAGTLLSFTGQIKSNARRKIELKPF